MNAIVAAAVIEFVGLCMFKQGDPRYPVHVVLPNVEESSTMLHHAQRNDIALVEKSPRRRVTSQKVITMDGHTAIIAWLGPAKAVTGWKPATLPPVPDYQYVALRGEQIRIVTTDPDVPAIPSVLPGITHGCENRPLRAEYAGPNYPTAAAVVKLSAGTLNSCHPLVNGERASRIDTQLTFDTNGPIVIETLGRPVKQLILDEKNLVVIGNVPSAWISTKPGLTYSLNAEAGHFSAYYSMLTDMTNCTRKTSEAAHCDGGPQFGLKETTPISNPTRDPIDTRRVNASFGTQYNVWREGSLPITPTSGSILPNAFVTYACSNSQYP